MLSKPITRVRGYRVEGSVIEVVIDVTQEGVEDIFLLSTFSEVAVCAVVRAGHLLDGGLVAIRNIGEPNVVGYCVGVKNSNDFGVCVEHDGSFQRGLIVLIISSVKFVLVCVSLC